MQAFLFLQPLSPHSPTHNARQFALMAKRLSRVPQSSFL